MHQPVEPIRKRNSRTLSGSFKHMKCVLVGDKSAEKTKVIIKYTLGEEHTSRTDRGSDAFDNYTAQVKLDNLLVEIDLWDVADQPETANVRTLCYPGTDIFLLFLNVVDPESALNMKTVWAREVILNAPTTPAIVVGTHIDERDASQSRGRSIVTPDEGQQFADDVGAAAYVEIGQNTPSQVVFERALTVALKEQTHGMSRRLKFVDTIMGEIKVQIDNEHKALNLALWRGKSTETENEMSSLNALRKELSDWTRVRSVLVDSAEADPTAESSCVVQ